MRPIKTLTQQTLTNNKQHIMTNSIALSLLAQGNNGAEILTILESISEETLVQESPRSGAGTDMIEF